MTPKHEKELYEALVNILENIWDRGDDRYLEEEEHPGMIVHEVAWLVVAFDNAFHDAYAVDTDYLKECRLSLVDNVED